MSTDDNAVMAHRPPVEPVDEAESDTTGTASSSTPTASSATSSASGRSYFYSRPLNFSRPRPVDYSPRNRVLHDRSDSCSTPGALLQLLPHSTFDSKRPLSLPTTPTFDFDDNVREDVVPDTTDFPWEEHLKDMKPVKAYNHYGAQRSQPRSLYEPGSAIRSDAVELPAAPAPHSRLQRPQSTSALVVIPQQTSSSIPAPARAKQAVYNSTPSIQELPEEECDGEDIKSHHTVSDNGDVAELGNSQWSSSSFDVRKLLGEKEIKKLKKKGINPALYAEMKAARSGRGKFGMNILGGNAYLS